jgi:hypothetical protein
VHIFKNILNNNLRNLKNFEKKFTYPDFNDFSTMQNAKDQKNPYTKEKEKHIN